MLSVWTTAGIAGRRTENRENHGRKQGVTGILPDIPGCGLCVGAAGVLRVCLRPRLFRGLGRHPRRHTRTHQAVVNIQRREPCVQQAGHRPADLHHLHRHEEQEASGVQRQAAGRPASDSGSRTACPLRVAVQQADGDAAVHAAREHHPVHGRFARGRDPRACSLGQHLEVHQGRTDEGPVQF